MTWPAASRLDAVATVGSADDAGLIERFLQMDDDDAFEILVRRYQDKVFRLAASILGRGAESEAEDATQEVFVVVLRCLKSFRRESAFSTWLYRLARNRIIDYRRRALRRPPGATGDALRAVTNAAVPADPGSAAARAERRTRLLRQIDRLDDPQRAVIHLHYWQGQSVAEISELLGVRPGTVKSHLFRARKRLAGALRGADRDA
jgi:RNA polymerase sigma-70 factor (ECF subfamily)